MRWSFTSVFGSLPLAASGLCIAAALALFSASTSCSGDRGLNGNPEPDGGGFHPGDTSELDDGGLYDLEAGPRYAVLGVQPSHGPFTGGTRIEIRGRGFSSQTKVRLGTLEIPATDTVANDPFHVQVITPPGDVGPTDVIVTDPITGDKALLASGFTYDSYYVSPNTGSTAGGTHVDFFGRGTSWIAGTTATIDGKPCTDLAIDDPTHLHCVAPPGTVGTKSVSITTPDKVISSVRDAYSYSDSGDGYLGGLAGEKLPGELKVLALVNPNGDLLPGATVVVRGSDGLVQTGTTASSGLAAFPAPPKAPLTVTVTAKCIQPTTFDGVNVRSVTVYLNPVMSVACIPPDGTPPPVGGKSRDAGVIVGELVWPGAIEFKRAAWKGVPPATKKSQRVVAYVFAASRDNLTKFQLPQPETATTETSPGTLGYAFTLPVIPGNVTIYAMAGVEDRPTDTTGGFTPPTFDPYVYGIVRGVGVKGGEVVDRVLVPMTGAFTHSVKYHIDGAPTSSRGPDRLSSTLALDLGDGGFMILPFGTRTDLLPVGSDLSFVGVPPLSGALGSAWYIAAVEDVTGGAGGAPISSVLRYRSRNDSKPIVPGPFISIPKFTFPAADKTWDSRTVTFDLPAKTADLFVLGIGSGDGSTAWTIVAQGDARTITLPDFSSKPELGLPTGNLLLGIVAARLPADFKYDKVSYGQLGKRAWQAYAYDTTFAKY